MSLGPLFGLAPSPIFVVPVSTALTSGLAWAWRVLAFPALGWPARLDFLRQGHGPLELIGFIGFGAPLGVVLPAGDSVLLSAFLAPRLSFDGGFNAVSAEAAGFGVGEFLLTIGSLYFSSGLGRQWDSLLFGILRYDYSLWFLRFGIICFCLLGNASVLFGRYSWVCSWSTFSWKREGMLEYNSFRTLCGPAFRPSMCSEKPWVDPRHCGDGPRQKTTLRRGHDAGVKDSARGRRHPAIPRRYSQPVPHRAAP